MLALGQRHPQRLSRPASRAWAPVSSAGVIASSRPRYQRKVQTNRTQPVVCAQPQRSSALEQDASPREPEEPEQEMSQLQLVLPISWELQIDEVVAKYENMDERLDAMERQLLEMTREMRTSTASLTGGVTTISSGGTAGLPATSGLSNAVIAPSEGEAADSAHDDKSGKPAPVAINDKSKSQVHASGTTERGTAHSGGLISPELNEREQIIEQGKAAAAIAKAAQEEEERAEQEEQEGGQLKEKKPKLQELGESGEQYKGGLWDSPLQQALGTAMQALNDVPQALIDSIPTPSGVEQQKHKQHKPRPPPQQQQQQQAGPPGAKKPPAAEAAAQTSVDGEDAALKDQQVDAVRERLLQQAQARAAGPATQGSRDDDRAEGTTSTKPTVKSSEKQGGTQGTAPSAEDWEHQQRKSHKQLLDRESLYGFNRLQSAITELANSGYIESVKQLRETLLIQEWDMSNRHLAKRRGVAMFERYVAERDLVHEIGGFAVISALYEDPDALDDLLPNDRMKMLARSMMEECLNERRMQLYYSCNQTAKDMATLTSSGMSSRLLVPLRTGLAGAAFRIWGMIRSTFLPWTRFLPFV